MRKAIQMTCLAMATAATLFASSAASAGSLGYRGWGPRAGVTFDPDQFHFGAHFDMGDLASHLRFQPNVEVGVGDNFLVAGFNAEALYFFAENWDGFSPYAGSGVNLNWVSFDPDVPGVESVDDLDAGIPIIGGVEKGFDTGRLLIEVKLGLIDSPDFKVTGGWTFGGR